MDRDRELEMGLFLVRVTIAIFMLVWAVDKIVNVQHAQGVLGNFYGWKNASAQILMVVGIAQTIILLMYAAGMYKFWTYGAVMLMHASSTIVGLPRMIPPYGPGSSMTFWAAVPVLAAMFVLFRLRERDRLFTAGSIANAQA